MRRSAEDAEAFRDFYVANAQRLVVFFTRRTLNAEVALDLTGETFAVEKIRTVRGEGLYLDDLGHGALACAFIGEFASTACGGATAFAG